MTEWISSPGNDLDARVVEDKVANKSQHQNLLDETIRQRQTQIWVGKHLPLEYSQTIPNAVSGSI